MILFFSWFMWEEMGDNYIVYYVSSVKVIGTSLPLTCLLTNGKYCSLLVAKKKKKKI